MEVPLWLTEKFVPKDAYYAAGYLEFNDDVTDSPKVELTFYYRTTEDSPKHRVDVLLGITQIGDVLATEPVPFE